MDMDELRSKWAEFDRKLETNLRINQHLLRVTYLGKAKSSLQWLAIGMVVEAAFDFAILSWLGRFAYEHREQMPFFLPGIGLYLLVLASFISLIRQIVLALTIDYSGPIAVMQKQLESLRVARIRLTQAVFLIAPLVWVPLLIVLLKNIGVDAYKIISPAYLWANVGFGVAFMFLGLWLSKQFSARMDRSPFLQQLMRDIAGESLTRANGYLETLAEFEDEGRTD